MNRTKIFISIKTIILSFFLIGLIILLQGCSSNNLSITSYRTIGASLKKSYNLSRGDLVAAYDLGKIDSTNCIYSADLGQIISDKYYASKYIQRFKSNFKSPTIIKKEAQSKIVRIYKLLLKVHKKHKILSNSQYQYIKKLSTADIRKINIKRELSNLDRLMKTIPVMLPIYKPQITSPYGIRKHPLKRKRSVHCGIDLVGMKEAPIYASAKGKVIFAGRQNGYGNVVEIQHNSKIKTVYAHLSMIKVKPGQMVERGVTIGRQGRTGSTTKEHLHFEVRINNRHVNPLDFISQSYRCK